MSALPAPQLALGIIYHSSIGYREPLLKTQKMTLEGPRDTCIYIYTHSMGLGVCECIYIYIYMYRDCSGIMAVLVFEDSIGLV